jgi:HEPN domain-containing protein
MTAALEALERVEHEIEALCAECHTKPLRSADLATIRAALVEGAEAEAEIARCLDCLEKSVETLADPECHYEHDSAESDAVTCIAQIRRLAQKGAGR